MTGQPAVELKPSRRARERRLALSESRKTAARTASIPLCVCVLSGPFGGKGLDSIICAHTPTLRKQTTVATNVLISVQECVLLRFRVFENSEN